MINVEKNDFSQTSWQAEQGNAEAQYQLGLMYSEGETTPQNFDRALFWLSKAARQGHPKAHYSLVLLRQIQRTQKRALQ
ncbi:Sel1 repeat protein [Beggiatoa alba B18LD]|uniref:Sel1 repeat protein n=1 Tax=Beggiatoa alba B18LD TaxID=395493 RepID=I3CL31_9GAMM|nr:SEL1-like repeat protein [Beggiatoa alba]EIJ44324.1 Sel1 repeat protein [Beggiatoa alba B18LD]